MHGVASLKFMTVIKGVAEVSHQMHSLTVYKVTQHLGRKYVAEIPTEIRLKITVSGKEKTKAWTKVKLRHAHFPGLQSIVGPGHSPLLNY